MSAPRDPGETFLGVSISVDPFAMLGLPRTRHDDAAVLHALGRRMAEIAEHARSQTPEANEIRLALHAAAAQLLDPQLQELLLTQDAPRQQERAAALVSPGTDEPRPLDAQGPMQTEPAVHPLSHDVLLVVAASGGWNGRAMRRLAMLAHARGIPSSEIPDAVSSVLAGPIAPQRSESPEETEGDSVLRVGSVAAPGTRAIRPPPPLGVRLAPWLIGTLTVVSLCLVLARLTRITEPQRPAADPALPLPPAEVAIDAGTPAVGAPGASAQVPAVADARSAARELIRLATQREAFDQPRLDAIALLHGQVAAGWTELGADQIGAIHNAVLEMLYRLASEPNRSLGLIAAIGEPLRGQPTTPDELRAWVWSVGTLSRLSMERNLPTATDSAIIGRLAGALGEGVRAGGMSFRESARAALTRAADRLATSAAPEALWRAWLDQLGAVAAPGDLAHTHAVLGAVESLMVLAEEPSQSRAVFQAIEALCSSIRLQPASPAAERLVAWHSDDRVSISDLSVVLRTLIARSRIPGIDESLILSPGSGVAERMAARATLASVLLGRDSDTAQAVASWVGIADQQLARVPGARPVDLVARAVVMSRLSEAARATLWGDEKQAESVLANLTGDVEQMIRDIGDHSTEYLGGNSASEWAIKYIDAKQNIPVRQALLADLTRGNRTLGPVAAEVVVRDAFLGTPASVRAQAREVVLLYASSPSVLNAVLEYLPRIPRVDANSQLIESVTLARLPAVTSPNWSLRARQAVVDELLMRVAGVGEGQVMDKLVQRLRASYETRLGRPRASQAPSAGAIELAEAAQQLSAHWRMLADQEVEDLTLLSALDDLDHRGVGRLLLAEGTLDRFAVYQSGAVETMAVLVMAENPAIRAQAEAAVAELKQRRREARNILEQIVACEEAAVKLWKLRLQRGIS